MPILTETFEGSPAGMDVAQPSQDLEDNEARYIQDALLDYPGLIRRRGPVRKVAGSTEFATKISGGVQTTDPQGRNRVGILTGDVANGYLAALSDTFATATNLNLGITLQASPPTTPYRIVSVSQCLNGGAVIGVSDQYSNPTAQVLVHWRGARMANYTTGTITSSLNSTAITGSGTLWSANVEPGMFLFSSTGALIGVVKTVNSNTSITLEKPALVGQTALAYTLSSLRGLNPKVMRGRITAATSDTVNKAVTGATTKFKDQGLGTGTWDIYRLSDYTFLGTVASVTSNTALTLAATPAIDMSNEAYVAVRRDGDYGGSLLTSTGAADRKVGFLTEVYAERQWFLNRGNTFDNTTFLWFSEPQEFEGLDLSPADGDFIKIGTSRGAPTPGRGLAAAYNGLLIMKENETYILRGTTRATFAVQKLADDGTLSGGSIQKYAGGVIWAGREGIYFYDGIQVDNISTAKLGDYYKNLIRDFDPSKYRLWSMITRDHYFLFVEDAHPNIAVVKGTKSFTPTQMTITVNLITRAFTISTNLNLRGAIQLPADSGEAVWYFVNGYPSALTQNSGTTAGGVATTLRANIPRGMKVTVASDGWVPRVTAYLDGQGSAALGTCSVRASLYSDSGGLPDVLLSQGNEVVMSAGQAAANIDFDLMDGVRLAAGTYHIVIHAEKDNFVRYYGLTGASGVGSTGLTRAYSTGPADPYGGAGIGAGDPLTVVGTPTFNGDSSVTINAAGLDGFLAPPTLLSGPQGWFAARFRAGFASTDATERDIALWKNAANTEAYKLFYRQAGSWAIRRITSGVSLDATLSRTHAIGDYVTLIGSWSAGNIAVSVNGSSFNGAATGAANPTTNSLFGIGFDPVLGTRQAESDMLWFACGTGTLTNADAAALHAGGNNDPVSLFQPINPTIAPTMVWTADDTGTLVPQTNTTYFRAWIQGAPTSTIKGYICDSAELFDSESTDDYGCDSGEPGPDWYYESKKFSAGDSLRKKLFKQLAVHYMSQGGSIRLDTVVGLNDQGKTSTSVYPGSSPTWDSTRTVGSWDTLKSLYSVWNQMVLAIFKPKRIKFLKRSTHLSFRLYQASPLITRLRMGPFQIGYKLQRPGRI